jgi:predicted alpha/beta hydrolase family esterase
LPNYNAIAKPWLSTKFDLKKVKSVSGKIKVFFSKDDQFVPFDENKTKFEEIGANIFVLDKRGHFTGEDGCEKFSELAEEILKDIGCGPCISK